MQERSNAIIIMGEQPREQTHFDDNLKAQLYHYSPNAIVDLYKCEVVLVDTYKEECLPAHGMQLYFQYTSIKPEGFWVSCESSDSSDFSWWDFCVQRQNEWSDQLTYKYHVSLAHNAKVLVLDTIVKMHEFNKKYICAGSPNISWNKVASEYQGILITPYHPSLRSKFGWYSHWDCASGCIWDMSIITKITPLQGG